ncbi:hypothetical protein [Alsobacter metallidurans]|nr:hypothetical protein [Alsobacter metallidurans]
MRNGIGLWAKIKDDVRRSLSAELLAQISFQAMQFQVEVRASTSGAPAG